MEDLQINLFVFLGVLELAIVLVLVALFLVMRGKRLAGNVLALQKKLKEVTREEAVVVGFEHYLRDEVLRNQELIDRAVASTDDAEKKAGELLQMRKQFLELEIEARALEKNPVEFQDRLAAGMSELVEQLRPEPETVTETVPEAGEQAPDAVVADAADEGEAERATVDTHDAEFNRLKDVINNQQDAMAALRKELEARENDIEDLDSILQKLDQFERQSSEMETCLNVLEQENERLKAARAAGDSSAPRVEIREPVELGGLKSMMGQQKQTIDNLQNLIRELAPEAGKAKELEESIDAITRTNRELNGCVTVLEDENTKLRVELEQIQSQLEQQEAQHEADTAGEPDVTLHDEDEDEAAGITSDEEKQELEIKVQELEALVEFKDAAIEELEKQYNSLEAKYLELTGEKKAN
ncbi:MAG: hypothetical protein ACE5FQ_04415 [Thiogranum sp.]